MPRPLSPVFVFVCALLPVLAGCDLALLSTRVLGGEGRPADELFEWQGRVAAGRHIEIKGVNGTITADRSTTGLVEVTADRRGARNDPNEVRVEVVEHAAGVTICAVYPSAGNACLPGDGGRLAARRNDVNVTFTVRVPSGVDFVARNRNGAIRASDLADDVEAHTVNGSIQVAAGGHAQATTVNGSLNAVIGRADWEGEASFESVNGGVTITLPSAADADISARTANGSIRTDLPITDTAAQRQRFEGRLGDGGRTLRVRTVNGAIRLQGTE